MTDLGDIDVMDGAGGVSAHGPRSAGEYGFTVEPPSSRDVHHQFGGNAEAPASGTYLTPAEQLYLTRIPQDQPLDPPVADRVAKIRRRITGHDGRLPRDAQTVESDLLLLDPILASRDTTLEDIANLEQEIAQIDAVLNGPQPHHDKFAQDIGADTVRRIVAEAEGAARARYQHALDTVPINNRTGKPDVLAQQEAQRVYQAELARIRDERPSVEREYIAALRQEREEKSKAEQARLVTEKREKQAKIEDLRWARMLADAKRDQGVA